MPRRHAHCGRSSVLRARSRLASPLPSAKSREKQLRSRPATCRGGSSRHSWWSGRLTPSTGGIRLSRRRKRSVALPRRSPSPRPSADVSGAGRLERAGCGRLGLQWKPRARLAAGDRGPGGWRRLQKRGTRCSGLAARAPGPERRRRVLLFRLGVWRPFPWGKRLFSHTSFPTSFPGQE